jgi:nucleotide-binding universal stress UspA family protein/predicted transcriptional regulator
MSRAALVPLDGSRLSELALPSACHLARTLDLKLVLLYVLRLPAPLATDPFSDALAVSMYREGRAAGVEDAEHYLGTVRQRLANEGLAVELVVREGDPGERILDVADEVGVRFIVMATHGRGRLARLALGSISAWVVQHATVPVLIVRSQHEAPARRPSLDRVLVPLDGSLLAERALDIAAGIASAPAELLLVRVDSAPPGHGSGNKDFIAQPHSQARDRAGQESETYLGTIARRLASAGRSVQVLARRGDPATEILRAAREHDVDLIVLSPRGPARPARWLAGGVADQVVRHSRRPVLLVSARALAARARGDFTVGDLMTPELTTLNVDESLMAAIRKLIRMGLGGAPVVTANGDLVGILSDPDVVVGQTRLTRLPAEQQPLSPDEYSWRLAHVRVGEVMARPAVTVEASATLDAASELFRKHRVRPLPVTQNGRLVGVIKRADVLKAMVSHWQPADATDR